MDRAAFGATPGKLPTTVFPAHYALELKPDLKKLAFDIDVTAPTERLVLNAVDLAIERAAIDGESGAPQITFDAGEQT
jgi:aminopeptidase N